jgi:Superinfection immunity protein
MIFKLFLLAMFVMLCFLYYAPTILAYVRKSVDLKKIVLINLVAGWTFIGWVVAMMMATTSQQTWQRDPRQPLAGATNGAPPSKAGTPTIWSSTCSSTTCSGTATTTPIPPRRYQTLRSIEGRPTCPAATRR